MWLDSYINIWLIVSVQTNLLLVFILNLTTSTDFSIDITCKSTSVHDLCLYTICCWRFTQCFCMYGEHDSVSTPTEYLYILPGGRIYSHSKTEQHSTGSCRCIGDGRHSQVSICACVQLLRCVLCGTNVHNIIHQKCAGRPNKPYAYVYALPPPHTNVSRQLSLGPWTERERDTVWQGANANAHIHTRTSNTGILEWHKPLRQHVLEHKNCALRNTRKKPISVGD